MYILFGNGTNLLFMSLINLCVRAQLCMTLCNPMYCSLPGSSVHGISPGKNAGVGCHFLLQGIFPTQGSNLVSCIAGRFFAIWATREDQLIQGQCEDIHKETVIMIQGGQYTFIFSSVHSVNISWLPEICHVLCKIAVIIREFLWYGDQGKRKRENWEYDSDV